MLKTGVRVGLVLLAMMCTGCCGGMKSFEVTMSLDDSLKDPQNNLLPDVKVNLVGVADGAELDRYLSIPIDSWFTENNDLRHREAADARLEELTFGPGQANPQTLTKDDSIWTRWDEHKAMNLVIFASIPLKESAVIGKEDPRRFVIPLSSCRWDGGDKLKIVIRQSGMDVDPQPTKAP